MMKKYFRDIPCGKSLPFDNPHAVSVNLPTIADVIAYEEEDPVLRNRLESAYPRFCTNPTLEKACCHVRNKYEIDNSIELHPISSEKAFNLIEKNTEISFGKITAGNLNLVAIERDSPQSEIVKTFIQNTGMIPSSRLAEDYLIEAGVMKKEFRESREKAEYAESVTKRVLAEAYEMAAPDDVFLCTAGMNAVFSAYDSIKEKAALNGRYIFVQVGWLYLDSMEIIKKYSKESFLYFTPLQLDELESFINANHEKIAAVFTEVPNNPSIQCFDLPRLSSIAKRYGIAVVIDSTMSTPYNVNVFPYADIAVESLTKYACGHGDVLMGAVVLNSSSSLAMELKQSVSWRCQKPYIKDIMRIAYEIKGYAERVDIVSRNTAVLVEWLSRQKKIIKLNWVMDELSCENFLRIRKTETSLPGLVSLVFDKDLHYYYDKLKMPKGPSLGTGFTIAMPYVYLAHYDMIKTPEGKKQIIEHGINPELLRISVGTENPVEIITALEDMLK